MSTNQRNGRAAHSSRSGSSAAQRRPTKGTNAKTSYEKYVALARGAALTGDAIETENYYQHAEHYFRLMKDERTRVASRKRTVSKTCQVLKGAINRAE